MTKIHPDARMPNDRERQELCKMLFHALIEIRNLGWEGKAERAGDLADAFHNLPVYLWSEQFSFGIFRQFLKEYQEKYAGSGLFDYVKDLDRIMIAESG
jgi:hypothetical protein